jgi:asparagine synthase (glutamine-hydrolysing)
MCAIFGALDPGGNFDSSSREVFVKLTDLAEYRGPNAAGHFSWNTASCAENPERFHVFLGHRRLSILDLSESANQPFTDDDRTWIVFNGEIFNYLELREELCVRGCVFSTNSDTEVLLKLYHEYGESGFDRLNGMWAFAILDTVRRSVILSRDRFSIKPLFLHSSGARLYFASEIKQLVSLLPQRCLNEEVMASYLDQGLLDHNEDTFWRGIRQLRPRHTLLYSLDSGEIDLHPYWCYPQREIPMSLDDAAEGFRHLFTDSVRIRLRSDVKAGALLSGGLDSSAIAAIAGRLHQPFPTFSAVATDPHFSEARYIDLLCGETRLKNHKLTLQSGAALDVLNRVLYHQDGPLGGFAAVAHYQLLEFIKQESDVVVILSGQGGDETLMGYLKFFFFRLRELAARGRILGAIHEVAASLINGTCVRQFGFSQARRYLPAYIPVLARRRYPFLRLPFPPDHGLWQAGDLRDRQIQDIERYSVPSLTHYEDRNSMAHSLEVRLPFLDHRLVEFLVGLPIEFKIHHGWTKFIMRHSLDELPNPIRWRKDKRWFMTPEVQWLRHDLAALIESSFKDSTLQSMGVLDDRLFLDHYRRFRSGRGMPHAEITRVLMAELWLKGACFS